MPRDDTKGYPELEWQAAGRGQGRKNNRLLSNENWQKRFLKNSNV